MKSKDREEQSRERLAAPGVNREIPTPEGEARMSAVILELAKPLLKQYGTTPERAEAIISLTIAAWNKSMLPPDKQSAVENDIIDRFVPKDGMAEDIGVTIDVMDLVAERRQELFPDLRKIIVDCDVTVSDGTIRLNVGSAPITDPD